MVTKNYVMTTPTISPCCCTGLNAKMACCSSLHKDIISLSDYVHGLAISDKRRYLEKI